MTFNAFTTWADLLSHIAEGKPVFYHAPMDLRPVAVKVLRAFKNGKIRVRAFGADAYAFTADPGHLNRFKHV